MAVFILLWFGTHVRGRVTPHTVFMGCLLTQRGREQGHGGVREGKLLGSLRLRQKYAEIVKYWTVSRSTAAYGLRELGT